MDNGDIALGFVYRVDGIVLYSAAAVLVGEGSGDALFRSRAVRFVAVSKHFFGGSDKNYRIAAGGISSRICNDFSDSFFSV